MSEKYGAKKNKRLSERVAPLAYLTRCRVGGGGIKREGKFSRGANPTPASPLDKKSKNKTEAVKVGIHPSI